MWALASGRLARQRRQVPMVMGVGVRSLEAEKTCRAVLAWLLGFLSLGARLPG